MALNKDEENRVLDEVNKLSQFVSETCNPDAEVTQTIEKHLNKIKSFFSKEKKKASQDGDAKSNKEKEN